MALLALALAACVPSHKPLTPEGEAAAYDEWEDDGSAETPAEEQAASPTGNQPEPAVAAEPVEAWERPEDPPAQMARARRGKIQKVWIWQETSDCLWNMAQEYYGDPFLWTKIYEANRNVIKDPNVIFPKQEILIPPLEDR